MSLLKNSKTDSSENKIKAYLKFMQYRLYCNILPQSVILIKL